MARRVLCYLLLSIMAQGHSAQESRLGPSPLSNFSEEQRHAFQQYETIVRFSDAVFSGKHPRIKPPSSIAPTQNSIHPRAKPAAAAVVEAIGFSSDQRVPLTNGQSSDLIASPSHAPAPNSTSTVSKPFGSGNTKINPILLEKSDDLIKAEIQLQRQRLERSLKEELEQRRAAARNTAQGEPDVDFDLSDVLSKALTLVQASAAAPPVGENVTAANQDAASDSFDDNTFYSSRHDTPESHLTSRVRNESEEAQPSGVANVQQPSNDQANIPSPRHRENAPSGNLDSSGRLWQGYPNASAASFVAGSILHGAKVPGLNNYSNENVVSSAPSQDTSDLHSRTQDSANIQKGHQGVKYGRERQQQTPYVDNRPPSPLVRAHELSPVAPQPAHVSSLALASRLPVTVESPSNQLSRAPAQVAALRNEPTVITSPDSSPSGGRASEKKKPKKKKRKADRQVPEAETTPYIKPEPRSQSPLNAPSYIRPTKRQRYSQRPPNEPEYEAPPRYEEPSALQPEAFVSRAPRDPRIPVGYERTSMHPSRSTSVVVASSQPYGREYVDDRRLAGETYVVHRPSNYANPEEVVWRNSDVEHDPRIQRRVVDPYGQPPQSHRGAYEPPRMSVRPEAERYIEVPPRPPTRIVVDNFGREYIEPQRPTMIRQPAAPLVRPDDPEIIYERTVSRAATRHVGVESYEEGPVYHRPSASYAMPRRVVTQPEYASQDYRESRQPEYSARPMAPQGDFMEVMAPPERRRPGEPARDYVARAASVRPPEPLRYEVPYDYGRVQSVRPEVPVRQYATSIHPESRREVPQSYVRDYGVRTVEQPAARQEYSVRPVEQYYEQPMRGGDDIAFIERPRGATQEIVYADDARREVYR